MQESHFEPSPICNLIILCVSSIVYIDKKNHRSTTKIVYHRPLYLTPRKVNDLIIDPYRTYTKIELFVYPVANTWPNELLEICSAATTEN